jgi:hypothetical protein
MNSYSEQHCAVLHGKLQVITTTKHFRTKLFFLWRGAHESGAVRMAKRTYRDIRN